MSDNRLFKVIYEDHLGYVCESIVCCQEENEILQYVQKEQDGLEITIKDIFALKNDTPAVLVTKVLRNPPRKNIIEHLQNTSKNIPFNPNPPIQQTDTCKQCVDELDDDNKRDYLMEQAEKWVNLKPILERPMKYPGRKRWT